MHTTAIVERMLRELAAAGDQRRAAHDRAYLKTAAQHWGVSVPGARSIAAGVPRSIAHDDLMAVVAGLWSAGPYDAQLVAALLLQRHAAILDGGDIMLLERLLRQSGTWALVDVLAPHPMAAIDEVAPWQTTAALDTWIADPDFWLRRAALLAHLVPLRASLHGWQRFAGYAEQTLDDREFFVRKAAGWVLREVARHHPERVEAWLWPRIDRISAVTLREACRPLSDPVRQGLLAAAPTCRVKA